MMRQYFSTLAAILTAVLVVLGVRSCSESMDESSRKEAIAKANATPTPYVRPSTPPPSFVRVTIETDVYGRDQKTAHLTVGTRVKVVRGEGPVLVIEYQGEFYDIDAAITTRD